MRQVSHSLGANPSYGIIGNGRLARHIQFYFKLKNIPHTLWHRQQPESPEDILNQSDIILLAISDDAIDAFLDEHPRLNDKLCVHFSGTLVSQHALSYHPLMTFSPEFQDLDFYQNLFFVGEDNAPTFSTIFPQLTNPFIQIPQAKKAYYHALCVMANNFTTLLWQKFFNEMTTIFNASLNDLKPYLKQTLLNIDSDYNNALTGPLKRQDLQTIEHNLDALEEDTFIKIYQAFVDVYQANLDNKTGEKHEYTQSN
ncbi:Rossmann-like and DUF2520 domain-containing protein [Cysteiniphilum sp. QT6929]|uniref:Rossmann-like and DUF2520 domain-containing protein n=1 Tax=Cysteiniphilum sp. QT6929 TaxID=2975055 RepID=UPI0024B328DB|nr:Rossmann-like and DUF2520 domain-containing protein [Cysteiniphilum sp. QT6929]WHN64644.1 DUF2520 domain-containing protein [Cysteiniphilum sp. QT6929]